MLLQDSPSNENVKFISWNDFYYQMLAKGEVEEVIIRPGIDIVTVVLHEGAVIKGYKAQTRTYHMNIIEANKFEEKLRAAEQKLGIPVGKEVPVVIERDSGTAGKLMTFLIIGAIAASFLSRMKGFRSPMSMSSFVSRIWHIDYNSEYEFMFRSTQLDSNGESEIHVGRFSGRRNAWSSICRCCWSERSQS